MKLHDALRKYGLVQLLALAAATWASYGISSDDIMVLSDIKANYVVSNRRRPTVVSTPLDVVDAANLPHETREHLAIVMTDHQHRLIGSHVIAIGSRDNISVCKQTIYELCSSYRAVNAYMVHNHPRGGMTSVLDIKFTMQVRDVLSSMNCNLVAHYVTDEGYATDVVTGNIWHLKPCDSPIEGAYGICDKCKFDMSKHTTA